MGAGSIRPPEPAADFGPEPAAWVRQHALPLDSTDPAAPATDLRPLGEATAPAVVVGVGGSSYGGHEHFTLGERIIRHLVEERGFRTVATEEDWGFGRELDRYVLTGEGDLDALMATANLPWRTAEVRDVLRWLRRYNETHAEPVRFAGVGAFDTRPQLYDAVLAHVAKAAPAALAELTGHLSVLRPDRPGFVGWFIGQVADKEPYVEHARAALRLVEELPHEEGDEEHAWAVQDTRQILYFYEHYAHHLIDDGYRDARMADNLRWWRERTGSRIVYWSTTAHSADAAQLAVAVPPRPALTFRTTGSHLREHYGAGYLSIGLTFDRGTVNSGWSMPPFTARPLPAPSGPAGFAERPLAEAGLPRYLLDLRGEVPPAVRAWLDAPAPTRIIGSIYDPEHQPAEAYRMSGGSLAGWFDLLVHCQELTPSQVL
ncbi:erythromycin esterase family protein [Kitasatospora viridis]|uniref:Erythromycin esterase n=1 Tax=Kitasatospora viridis TaxID=281105 RepID=A0A561UCF2_9ACTN|nr:erythromycin esterase family protein [Kitasatospora viridis]TWF97045.1 erythromycin esterase [Kitasatospora viridis]